MKPPPWPRLAWWSLGVGTLVLLAWNQAAPVFADPDAFYHMTMAQLLAEQGIIRDFVWLPYTTLAQHYIDQHWLFHLLLLPFVIGPFPFIGTKIFTILLGTAMVLTFAWLLKSLHLRWWWLVTAVLVLTNAFTFRLNLVKATPLALILLCLGIWCLHKRWFGWLVAVSAVYVWTYGGFAMLGIVTVVWVISDLRHIVSLLRPLAAVVFGFTIGLVLNPYFPNNLYFYWDQLVQIGIINYQDTIGVGSEWYPYAPAGLVMDALLLCMLAVSGVVSLIVQRKRWLQLDWFALGIWLVGLILTLKSRRYVEYFGPFTALAAAIWLNSLPPITAWWRKLSYRPWSHALGAMGLVMCIVMAVIPVVLNDVRNNAIDVRAGTPWNKYRAASQWLQQHAPPGSKILHSDWDDFPSLFYYNRSQHYMAGLDPTFMYRADQDRYWLWVRLTTGKYRGDVDAALTTLAVAYVVIEQDHGAMFDLIEPAKRTQLVYSDDTVDIFRVKQ